MKKYLFLVVSIVLALVGCVDHQVLNETMIDNVSLFSANEFNALIEQARWGDGQAFLKLADCFQSGKGVEKDVVGALSMVAIKSCRAFS